MDREQTGTTRRQAYREYLNSDDWKRKRTAKHARSSGRCSVCRATKQLDVHHLEYRNWYDVRLSDLRLLCRSCHDIAHRLMDTGRLTFKPGSDHHARYALLKRRVIEQLVRDRDRQMLRPVRAGEFVVTVTWLRGLQTSRGGWSRSVLARLNVPWPPPKGWLSRQAGRQIPDVMRLDIERLATEREK